MFKLLYLKENREPYLLKIWYHMSPHHTECTSCLLRAESWGYNSQSQQKIRKMLPGWISSQILLHFDGINNTSAWIHPTLYQRCWCWSKGYGDIFLVLSGPHSSKRASFKPHSLLYLSIFADLYEHSYNHQIISNWFLQHANKFTVLKWPPQSPFQQKTFGMWWNKMEV